MCVFAGPLSIAASVGVDISAAWQAGRVSLSPHGGDRYLGGDRGLSLGCRLNACCGQRRLALFGNGQCGVGLRRRTALAASVSWDDLVCSGPWRVAQLGWAIQCGTSSEDGASDFLGLLLWRRWLDARVKQRGKVKTVATAWLFDRDPGARGIFVHHSDGDF